MEFAVLGKVLQWFSFGVGLQEDLLWMPRSPFPPVAPLGCVFSLPA